MKQQDIAALIIIVFMAAIFSYFISNKFVTPSDEKLVAEVVNPINADFPLPDNEVFNDQALNPTAVIEIGPNKNEQPFKNQE